MIDSESAARAWLAAQPDWSALCNDRLERLVALLREENTRQNLVSAASLDSVWQRHIADSAQLLLHVPRETTGSWLDLGSGAGFPGLVIAALQPSREVVLVESRSRRCDWLERAIMDLDLHQVSVAQSRLEVLSERKVCVISARAFAPLPRLLEISARFSTCETRWVLPKGASAQQELQSLSGWRHMFHVEPSLTDPQAGLIVGRLLSRKGGHP